MSQSKPAPQSTSHAHNIEPVNDGKLGDASRNVADQFAKAKAAQLAKKQDAAKQQSPNLSFARNVEMGGKETKLDAASQTLRSQYDRAKAGQIQKQQAVKTQEAQKQQSPNAPFSRNIKMDDKETKLDAASKTLHSQYDRAKAGQDQKQQATRQPSPNASFARSIQTDGKETKLDAASQTLRSQYDRAKAAQLSKMQGAPGMKAPAPAANQNLTPKNDLQKAVDRPHHYKKLADYDKYVKGLSDSIKSRQDQENRADLQNDRTKDHDRGR